MFRYRDLFKESVGSVTLRLRVHTSGARRVVVLDEGPKSGPDVFASGQFDGLVLTHMAGEDVVVFVSEDSEPEVVSVGDIDVIVMS